MSDDKKYQIEVVKDASDIIPSIKKNASIYSKILRKKINEKVDEGKIALDAQKDVWKYEFDTRTLRPVFVNHLMDTEFDWPSIICITEKDDEHKKSYACDNSSGHISLVKGVRILNAYRKELPDFSIHFLPDDNKMYYIKHPFKFRTYVAIDDFFDVLYEERLEELQSIFYQLGCTYMKVTYKQESKSFMKSDSISYSYEEDIMEMSSSDYVEREACKLEYFEDCIELQEVLGTILDSKEHGNEYKVSIPVNSKGMSLEEAAKFDRILNKMDLAGNTLFTSEVNKDNRCVFEITLED